MTVSLPSPPYCKIFSCAAQAWTENALPPGYADLDDGDGARGVFEEGPSGITAGALSPGEVCVPLLRKSLSSSFESRCVILSQ